VKYIAPYIVYIALSFCASGCMTTQALSTRIELLKQKHNVTVKADNPLSRCYLFGYLPGLLNRIDKDLDKCPQYFKDNIGPILIEESFADNPAAYPIPFWVRGYVDPAEYERRFPIHIKNRSLLEKLVFPAPRDGELFLHEATHSFEFNMAAFNTGYWKEFLAQFDASQSTSHGGIAAMFGYALFPPLGWMRPHGMPSFYGWVNHWEDVAETHCYLRRHGDVDFLSSRDKALYDKCRLVDAFTKGETLGEGLRTGQQAPAAH